MKKIYITPAFIAVELGMRKAAMLSASTDSLGGSSSNILTDGGTGNGSDIGAKGVSDVNLWDNEW